MLMRKLAFLISTCMLVLLPMSFARAAELVMIEQAGCHWCEKWNSEISHIYPKTDEGKRAPLRRVDIHDLPQEITFKSRPVFTPTFILVDAGQELGRIEGYPGEDFFWFLLTQLLDQHPDKTVAGL